MTGEAPLTAGPFATVLGRCSGCAGRWPTDTPPPLCMVTWEPSTRPPYGELEARIHRLIGRSRRDIEIGLGGRAGAAGRRTTMHPWPLERGEPLVVRCPRCKVEHRVRPGRLLARADTARREGGEVFYLP